MVDSGKVGSSELAERFKLRGLSIFFGRQKFRHLECSKSASQRRRTGTEKGEVFLRGCENPREHSAFQTQNGTPNALVPVAKNGLENIGGRESDMNGTP